MNKQQQQPKLPKVFYPGKTSYIVPNLGRDAEDLFIGDRLCMATFCGRKTHKKQVSKEAICRSKKK